MLCVLSAEVGKILNYRNAVGGLGALLGASITAGPLLASYFFPEIESARPSALGVAALGALCVPVVTAIGHYVGYTLGDLLDVRRGDHSARPAWYLSKEELREQELRQSNDL